MADVEPSTSQQTHKDKTAVNDVLDDVDDNRGDQLMADETTMAMTDKPDTPGLLHAARLSKLIQHQPRYGLHKPSCILAWSTTNTIAIARSKRITLVHLLAPARVAHIPTVGRASLLSFSPRGNALIATFPDSRRTTVWTRENGTLNEWRVAGEWQSFEGRILDVQWLSYNRKVSTETMRRLPYKGPQMDTLERALSLLLVTDAGQVILLCNDAGEESAGFRVSTTRLDLGRQMRLRQASIGLVADESLALLAYTKRQSTKVAHFASDAESRAMQMFFDDTDAISQDEEKGAIEDGQDCLHIAEIRIDLYGRGSEANLSVRSVLPIFVASYGDPYLPYADKITQLMWLDGPQQSQSDESVPLRLFASFVDEGMTTIRTWTVHRENVNKVSSAFTNLSGNKDMKVVEPDEDWVATDGGVEKFEHLQLGDFVICDAWHRTLLCSSMEVPQFEKTEKLTNIRIGWSLLDVETLSIAQVEGGVTTAKFRSHATRLAVSPHHTLAVGAVHGKLTVTTLRMSQMSSLEDTLATAIFNGEDLSDMLRQGDLQFAVANVESKLKLPSGLHLSSAIQLVTIRCRLTDDEAVRQTSLLLLEMINSQKTLNIASGLSNSGSFHLEHVHAIAAHFRWYMRMLQALTRQAYIVNLKDDALSPSVSDDDDEELSSGAKNTDLLSLFTHKNIRILASKGVARFVAFYNFVSNIAAGVGSEAAKAAFKAHAGRCAKRGTLPMTIDTFTICSAQLKDILSGSAIDISRVGRLLKNIDLTEDGVHADEKETAWYLCERASDKSRAQLAKKIVKGYCIVDALRLCAPQEQWASTLADMVEDEHSNLGTKRGRAPPDHDILTRAPLMTGKGRLKMCLSCGGRTEIHLTDGIRCLCAAKLWWAVEQR